MIVRYTKYIADMLGLAKMSSDAIYGNLLYDFVTSSAINYKKFRSVELSSVQQVFGTNRSGITSGDCMLRVSSIHPVPKKNKEREH